MAALAIAAARGVRAQEPIYDESRVPDYELPDPLVLSDGTKVTDAKTWWNERRTRILHLFEEQVYGKAPGRPTAMWFETLGLSKNALGGTATRKQVRIHLVNNGRTEDIDLLMYLPVDAERPAPVFLGLNFQGNHTVYPDSAIRITDEWVHNNEELRVTNHRATAAGRGARHDNWPVERIIARGYGLVTANYGDIDPDYPDFQNGVHRIFYEEGQMKPAPDEWGAIGAWAWGLSRIMDYLETDPAVNAGCVAVMGHSRLGKTALWAGAQDRRFAMVISNESGEGGASLSKRIFGETVGTINTEFPHWFADNYNQYSNNVAALPVDQHMLIALIAPRPVYIAAAEENLWTDPHGMFLAAKHAEPVYRLLDAGGLAAESMPDVSEPVMSKIGYHVRPGEHDVTDYDWEQFMNFADKWLPCRQ